MYVSGKVTDLRLLPRTPRETPEVTELIPALVNSLIERIEVRNSDKSSGHCCAKVDIYFTAVGLFDIPTEQQLIDTMERVKQKNAEKSA